LELLTFPRRCRKIINESLDFNQEEIKQFWAQLYSFESQLESDCSDDLPSLVQDAICGGIAVLFLLHREWLESNPARVKWCKDMIDTIISNPPSRSGREMTMSANNARWNCFLAELWILYLSEDKNKRQTRKLVAESVMNYFYDTTEIAMNRAYQFREKLGDDFDRLQNLTLLWAMIRPILYKLEYLNVDKKRWTILCDRFVKKFITKELPVELLNWERLSIFTERVLSRLENKHGFGQLLQYLK